MSVKEEKNQLHGEGQRKEGKKKKKARLDGKPTNIIKFRKAQRRKAKPGVNKILEEK